MQAGMSGIDAGTLTGPRLQLLHAASYVLYLCILFSDLDVVLLVT